MGKRIRVAVVGGGPGGYVAAIRAAQLGAEVTLIEKENLGGTCLNVGCIPTKALLHTAALYAAAQNGASCGVSADVKLDFAQAQKNKERIVQNLVSGVKNLLSVKNIRIIQGVASFASKSSLHVEGKNDKQTIVFDKAIIATGSIPATLPIPGSDSEYCIDSTGALALPDVPTSMVIIGGGVIGMEFASLYADLGAKITVVEMLEEILPPMDSALSTIVRRDMEKRGVKFLLNTKVISIQGKDNEASVQVKSDDGNTIEIFGEKVLIAVGRQNCSANLHLDAAGINHDKGWIVTNSCMETNVKGIYAVGDCNRQILLAHAASAQGEVAAENALGHNGASFDGKTIASCVYTTPECASVGLTEDEAKKKQIPYEKGVFPLIANGRALTMGETSGIVKILSGKKYSEILGVHIVGPGATELIAEACLAIGMEATIDELIATIHAHPTISEAVREAALGTRKRMIHMP